MSDHVSIGKLNALADGELPADQLIWVTDHLHSCPACTSFALEQSLLRSATMRAGQRYTPSNEVLARMERLISSQNSSRLSGEKNQDSRWSTINRSSQWSVWSGWAAAACLLVLAGILGVITLNQRTSQTSAGNRAALATELSDQHIATLAANLPPQVLSSDRHTVKPWFQGKLPFTFNLPENLPEDIKLEGANLTYVHGRPAAQLLYSIGRHRVSVFLQQQASAEQQPVQIAQRAGFHLASFHTKDLDVIGISDVDPTRLTDLMSRIEQVQAK